MKRGSYTVEASLLMGILIPLLAGVIYLGFYLEIRAETYGKAVEKVMAGILSGGKEERDGVLIEGDEISARTQKEVPIPAYGGSFFGIPSMVRSSYSAERLNPAKTIFRIHSLKKLVRAVKT